jgi:hypothetical protein
MAHFILGTHHAQCHKCHFRIASSPCHLCQAIPTFINERLHQQAVGRWSMRAYHNAAIRDEESMHIDGISSDMPC